MKSPASQQQQQSPKKTNTNNGGMTEYLIFVENDPLFNIGYTWINDYRRKNSLKFDTQRSVQIPQAIANFPYGIHHDSEGNQLQADLLWRTPTEFVNHFLRHVLRRMFLFVTDLKETGYDPHAKEAAQERNETEFLKTLEPPAANFKRLTESAEEAKIICRKFDNLWTPAQLRNVLESLEPGDVAYDYRRLMSVHFCTFFLPKAL